MKVTTPFRRSRRTNNSRTQKLATLPDVTRDMLAMLDGPAEKDLGTKCELRMYEKRLNSRGEYVLLESGRRSDLGVVTGDTIDSCLVLTRHYSHNKELINSVLEIRSPYIRAALKQIVPSYPGVNVNSEGPICLSDEPRCLFHYRDELHSYAMDDQKTESKEHVLFLLQYMKKILATEISSYENYIQNEDIPPGLEFWNLWMVFKPGSLLCFKRADVDHLCRLRSMNKVERQGLPDIWRLETERIVYDGSDFRFCHLGFDIMTYSGYRPLAELELYPLKYHEKHEAIRASILERGKKYITFQGFHHCEYEGFAHFIEPLVGPYRPPPGYTRRIRTSMIQDRVITDTEEYRHANGDPQPLELIPGSKIIRTEFREELRMSEEELLMCVPDVPGFTLATKKWGMFDVSHLKPVKYNKAAFQSLLLPKDLKTTLSSLLSMQEDGAVQFDDLIKGKGKGLILLLHGPPGVGKTYTAESIAEHSERPLYTLGKLEIGGPLSSEKMSSTLVRAARWKSMVLLDEADVLMQERTVNELYINEQVLVMLRLLEYFEGIMILTTNRVQTIDPAFKSRIHLSLTYPPLTSKYKSQLWKIFILKSSDHLRPRWLTAKFLKTISAENTNGRDIKNIVRVAHALAMNSKRSINANDILQGLRYLKDFDRDFSRSARKRDDVDIGGPSPTKRIKANK